MNNELIHADESKKLIQALIPENRRDLALLASRISTLPRSRDGILV